MGKNLMPNPSINQYVNQNFPVQENNVEVITFLGKNGKHAKYLCRYFRVEVVKDYDGFISYIVMGETLDKTIGDAWIMRTDDFNKAYDLKNRLDELCSRKVNDRQKMHCYGSLQRKMLSWEK